MSATDDLRAYAKESLSPGRALERKMVTARQMDALRAERDEAIAELGRLREAIHEHRAQVLMGARSEYDVNEADEALWAILTEEQET